MQPTDSHNAALGYFINLHLALKKFQFETPVLD